MLMSDLIKKVIAIAIAVSLMAVACVVSPSDSIPTTHASETIKLTFQLTATITPSAIATWTAQPLLTATPSVIAITAPPTSTTMPLPKPVRLDCSPAFYLMQLGVSDKPREPIDVAVSNSLAYVLDREGLWIIDVSDPTHPIDVGFEPMLESKQVIVEGGYAFVINTNGLWVLELSDSIVPDLIGYKDTPDVPMELSINKGFAYVRDDYGILHIFDLANPTSLKEIGVYDPPGQILPWEIYGNLVSIVREAANENSLSSFSVVGDYIYVADLDGGLRVISISDPTRPDEIGSNVFSPHISDVNVVGNQAYIFSVDEELNINMWDLWVLDISVPIALDDPTYLGMIQLEQSIKTSGLCNFISEVYHLLRESELIGPDVAKISLKDHIALLKGVEVLGDMIYVADEEQGLVILQIIPVDG